MVELWQKSTAGDYQYDCLEVINTVNGANPYLAGCSLTYRFQEKTHRYTQQCAAEGGKDYGSTFDTEFADGPPHPIRHP